MHGYSVGVASSQQTAEWQKSQIGAQANAYPTPKELGFLQRIDGVRGGLEQIESRLRNLASRIGGVGDEAANEAADIPSGIPANLARAEQSIRNIMDLLNGFDKAF